MLDWLNVRLGEIIGLIHALEKRYYQNKTQLRYNFGSVYIQWTWQKTQSKKISNDQELIQSDPNFCPQNQKRNN